MGDQAAKKLTPTREPLTWRMALACSAFSGVMVIPVCLMRRWPIVPALDQALVVALVGLAIWRAEVRILAGPSLGRTGLMGLGFVNGMTTAHTLPFGFV